MTGRAVTPVLPASSPVARVTAGGDLWRVGAVMVTSDRHVRLGRQVWSPEVALQMAANIAAAATLALGGSRAVLLGNGQRVV